MARSAPSASQAAHFSAEPAVAKTAAPKAFASMMAVVPMPDRAAMDEKALARLAGAPRSKTLVHTVKKVSGMAPASIMESPLGHRQGVVLGGDAIFRIAAARHERADLVADLVALDPGTRSQRPAGDLEARRQGRPGGGG